jgi:hypothetical protein
LLPFVCSSKHGRTEKAPSNILGMKGVHGAVVSNQQVQNMLLIPLTLN